MVKFKIMLLNSIIKINNKIKNFKIPFTMFFISHLSSFSPRRLEIKTVTVPTPGSGWRHEPESHRHRDLQPRGHGGSRRGDCNSGGGHNGSRHGDCDSEEVAMEACKSEDVVMVGCER